MDNEIINAFGNKLRVRTCGILIENNQILLMKHHALGDRDFLLCPPGGGVEFGEKLTEGVIREFKEETHLSILVKELLFITEYIENPLHAIEFFFEVKKIDGKLALGYDPELAEKQIITSLDWYSIEELKVIEDKNKHSCLHNINSFDDFFEKNKSLY